LNAAEEAAFELPLTPDRRIRYQQNLRGRRFALVVLTGSTRWSRVGRHADRIAAAVASATESAHQPRKRCRRDQARPSEGRDRAGYEDAAAGKVIRLQNDDEIDALFADLRGTSNSQRSPVRI
jgi:hypothetical protein